jgi:hypothetical protein
LIATAAHEEGLQAQSWEWFTAYNGGISAILACHKRHASVVDSLINVMEAFAKNNLLMLFGTFIKQYLNDMME